MANWFHSLSAQSSFKCATSARKTLLAQCFNQQSNELSSLTKPHQEIDDYLNQDFHIDKKDEEEQDIDILNFWRHRQGSFPTLSLIVRKVFAIPASNTFIERLFSSSKMSVGEHMTNLGGEKLNQLMFLKKTLDLMKGLRQVKKVPSKRPSSNSVATMLNHISETTVEKVREDEEKRM